MNILLIDVFSDKLIADLQTIATKVSYLPKATKSEILTILPEYEILILNSKIAINKEVIDISQNLQLVLRAGVGMDHFDEAYLAQKGIAAFNTAGANADSVAEQCMGMLLSLRHNIVKANTEVKQFLWNREANRGIEIHGKTVGIIGYGHTGSAVAQKLKGFGCTILAYDKYKTGFGKDFVREVDLARIFAESDILTLHIPLTAETKHWVNFDFFAHFQKNITFLNLSRGEIVVLKDLIKALDTGKVLFAALDVLENEKFDTLTATQKTLYTHLFSYSNVVVTPHIGGWSVESKQNIENMLFSKVKEYIEKEVLIRK